MRHRPSLGITASCIIIIVALVFNMALGATSVSQGFYLCMGCTFTDTVTVDVKGSVAAAKAVGNRTASVIITKSTMRNAGVIVSASSITAADLLSNMPSMQLTFSLTSISVSNLGASIIVYGILPPGSALRILNNTYSTTASATNFFGADSLALAKGTTVLIAGNIVWKQQTSFTYAIAILISTSLKLSTNSSMVIADNTVFLSVSSSSGASGIGLIACISIPTTELIGNSTLSVLNNSVSFTVDLRASPGVTTQYIALVSLQSANLLVTEHSLVEFSNNAVSVTCTLGSANPFLVAAVWFSYLMTNCTIRDDNPAWLAMRITGNSMSSTVSKMSNRLYRGIVVLFTSNLHLVGVGAELLVDNNTVEVVDCASSLVDFQVVLVTLSTQFDLRDGAISISSNKASGSFASTSSCAPAIAVFLTTDFTTHRERSQAVFLAVDSNTVNWNVQNSPSLSAAVLLIQTVSWWSTLAPLSLQKSTAISFNKNFVNVSASAGSTEVSGMYVIAFSAASLNLDLAGSVVDICENQVRTQFEMSEAGSQMSDVEVSLFSTSSQWVLQNGSSLNLHNNLLDVVMVRGQPTSAFFGTFFSLLELSSSLIFLSGESSVSIVSNALLVNATTTYAALTTILSSVSRLNMFVFDRSTLVSNDSYFLQSENTMSVKGSGLSAMPASLTFLISSSMLLLNTSHNHSRNTLDVDFVDVSTLATSSVRYEGTVVNLDGNSSLIVTSNLLLASTRFENSQLAYNTVNNILEMTLLLFNVRLTVSSRSVIQVTSNSHMQSRFPAAYNRSAFDIQAALVVFTFVALNLGEGGSLTLGHNVISLRAVVCSTFGLFSSVVHLGEKGVFLLHSNTLIVSIEQMPQGTPMFLSSLGVSTVLLSFTNISSSSTHTASYVEIRDNVQEVELVGFVLYSRSVNIRNDAALVICGECTLVAPQTGVSVTNNTICVNADTYINSTAKQLIVGGLLSFLSVPYLELAGLLVSNNTLDISLQVGLHSTAVVQPPTHEGLFSVVIITPLSDSVTSPVFTLGYIEMHGNQISLQFDPDTGAAEFIIAKGTALTVTAKLIATSIRFSNNTLQWRGPCVSCIGVFLVNCSRAPLTITNNNITFAVPQLLANISGVRTIAGILAQWYIFGSGAPIDIVVQSNVISSSVSVVCSTGDGLTQWSTSLIQLTIVVVTSGSQLGVIDVSHNSMYTSFEGGVLSAESAFCDLSGNYNTLQCISVTPSTSASPAGAVIGIKSLNASRPLFNVSAHHNTYAHTTRASLASCENATFPTMFSATSINTIWEGVGESDVVLTQNRMDARLEVSAPYSLTSMTVVPATLSATGGSHLEIEHCSNSAVLTLGGAVASTRLDMFNTHDGISSITKHRCTQSLSESAGSPTRSGTKTETDSSTGATATQCEYRDPTHKSVCEVFTSVSVGGQTPPLWDAIDPPLCASSPNITSERMSYSTDGAILVEVPYSMWNGGGAVIVHLRVGTRWAATVVPRGKFLHATLPAPGKETQCSVAAASKGQAESAGTVSLSIQYTGVPTLAAVSDTVYFALHDVLRCPVNVSGTPVPDSFPGVAELQEANGDSFPITESVLVAVRVTFQSVGPEPPSLTPTVVTGTVVGAVGTVVSGVPSALIRGGIATSLRGMLRCVEFDPTDEVDRINNPPMLAVDGLGNDAVERALLSFRRGSAVIGLCVIGMVFLLVFASSFVRIHMNGGASTWRTAFLTLRLPSSLLPVSLLVGEMSSGSSVALLLYHPANGDEFSRSGIQAGTDAALAIVVFCVPWVVFGYYAFASTFGCHVVTAPIPEEESSDEEQPSQPEDRGTELLPVVGSVSSASSDDESPIKMTVRKTRLGRFRAAVRYMLEPTHGPVLPSNAIYDEEQEEAWLQRHYFFVAERRWIAYGAAEAIVGSLVDVIEGVPLTSRSLTACAGKPAAMGALLLVLVVLLLWKRPMAVRVQQWGALSTNVLLLLGSALITANVFAASERVEDAASYVIMMSSLLIAAFSLMDLLCWLMMMFPSFGRWVGLHRFSSLGSALTFMRTEARKDRVPNSLLSSLTSLNLSSLVETGRPTVDADAFDFDRVAMQVLMHRLSKTRGVQPPPPTSSRRGTRSPAQPSSGRPFKVQPSPTQKPREADA